MDDLDYSVAGLPLHVLLVHAVLVATPLLALLLVTIAVWPGARRVLWLPALIGASLLLPLGLVTIEAGKWLEVRVPPAPLIQTHTATGEDIVAWLVALLVLAALIAVWAIVELVAGRRAKSRDGAAGQRAAPGRGIRVAVGVVLTLSALVIAGGSTWTLVQIGESGSRAVWEGSFSDPIAFRRR